MIERETERGREVGNKEGGGGGEEGGERKSEWVRERVTCAKILKQFDMMDMNGLKSSLAPDGK